MNCESCLGIKCQDSGGGRYVYNSAVDEGKLVTENVEACPLYARLQAVANLGLNLALLKNGFKSNLSQHRDIDPD